MLNEYTYVAKYRNVIRVELNGNGLLKLEVFISTKTFMRQVFGMW